MMESIPDDEINLLNLISQVIFDKKGFNILSLDVREISTMTDFVVIAEGTVGRHVKSLSRAIKDALQEKGVLLCRSDGENEGEWIVLDFGEFFIHLLTPDFREKYALEELWNKATIVDVKIIVS